MRLSIAVALGIVGAVSLSTAADARDGCGRGYYFDGYACAPYGPPPPPPPYAGGYGWGGPPPGYYVPQPQPHVYYGQPRVHYGNVVRPSVGANGQISCGNPRYTWQNGACRPYTGR